jgi:trk system potassium uptake protein
VQNSSINWSLIFKLLGVLLILVSLFMLTGIPFSIYYGDDDILALLFSAGITFLSGLAFYLLNLRTTNNISKREGYLIVSLSWVVVSFFGSLPYILGGYIPNFSDAFFETMSGFTTTGATILTDIESLPHGILFWRHMTHWLGGMGIIVLTLAILPFLGIGGTQLFIAEVPGQTADKLHPRITGTAKRLWGVYVILTLMQTGLLMIGKMNLWEALCHSFSTMATGGFSTRNASAAAFSPYIQYVLIFFMFLAGMNFAIHYYVMHRKFYKLKNDELKYYSYLILFSAALIAGSLIIHGHPIEKTIRDSLFQVVSIITTTGFVTTDYLVWPPYAWFLIFLLLFTGGCLGSTGGGVKAMRQLLLLRNSRTELKKIIHPRAIVPVRYNGRVVPQEIIFNVMAFFIIYMIVFLIGATTMSLLGLDFESAAGSAIACLGNTGPGIGSVGPIYNYSHIPEAGKWVLSILMLLGRLELFTVLILFSPSFWKK